MKKCVYSQLEKRQTGSGEWEPSQAAAWLPYIPRACVFCLCQNRGKAGIVCTQHSFQQDASVRHGMDPDPASGKFLLAPHFRHCPFFVFLGIVWLVEIPFCFCSCFCSAFAAFFTQSNNILLAVPAFFPVGSVWYMIYVWYDIWYVWYMMTVSVHHKEKFCGC